MSRASDTAHVNVLHLELVNVCSSFVMRQVHEGDPESALMLSTLLALQTGPGAITQRTTTPYNGWAMCLACCLSHCVGYR